MASEVVFAILRVLECLLKDTKGLKGELRWNNLFSKTQGELAAVARQVRREIKDGKSTPFISDDEYLRSIDKWC
ncbi:MAG: hypothetical protein D3908_07220 [Candidatus Electrothrix sp. AUS4]|nr:hypothetical protein [Candidatus Electrothrix sp. AUS4]